jgi:CheY-like chemotaxis protein
MVYGFVKQSSGHVKIYSEPGHGTTVKIYLPRAERTAVAAESAAPVKPQQGSETILVVEDDRMVRQHAENQLAALGYRVLSASSGLDALEIIQRSPEIDLLFTDVILPGGMNGPALAEAARKIRPALKVLFTSGYTENAIVHHGRLDQAVLLLNKPYRRADLARKVRAALNADR